MSITKDGFFKQKDQLSNVYVLLAAGGHQRFGNAVGDIPVSNQLLNAGLDADMLDGKHIDELFTAFSGGAISSSGNTMSQADHSITIGGVTLYAGSSSANIVNNISVSTLLSNMTTNLTVGITVNGVASSNVSLTDLYARDSDKLDGKHINELFTEFDDIGSQTTRITVGGVTKDLKIDADKLDGKHIDELFTAFTGGTISSANNTLTQTNHAITIGGVTLYAGSSTANIINSLSVSKLTSDSTTNLTVGITVNGVASADKTITDLYATNAGNADTLDGYHFQNLEDRYVNVSGDWMDDSAQLYWKGLNSSTSVYTVMGYNSYGSTNMPTYAKDAHNDTKAFYIMSNGYNDGNDWGGLSIDDEGVSVFGAGDGANNFTGVFRVFNEDNFDDGPQFIVTKGSGATTKYSHTAQRFISTVAIGTQPYACSSTTLNNNLNADLLDDKHATQFLEWEAMKSGWNSAPFQEAVDYFKNLSNLNNGAKILYSYYGGEYTMLFTRRNDATAHGSILKWGYPDNYIRIIRMVDGSAQSTDWEKISAGYADRAGTANYATNAGNADTLDGYHLSNLYWANINVQTSLSTDTTPQFGRVGIGTAYKTDGDGLLNFPRDNVAINFRQDSGCYSKIEYMSLGNEALVFANQYPYSSFIFKNNLNLTNTNDWQESNLGTPAVQIKYSSLYINKAIGNGVTPDYNFYVNGNSYLNGRTIINYAASNGTGALEINAGGASYAYALDIQSSIATGDTLVACLMGVSHGTNNQLSGLFKYVGSGSTSNLFGFGFYNNDFLLNIRADGNVGIGTQSPSYKLDVNGTAHATRVIINNANVGSDSLTVGGCIRITGGPTTSNMNAGLRRIFFGDGTNACLGEGGNGEDSDWMYIRGYHKILLECNSGSTTIDINGYPNSPGFKKNGSSDSYVLLGAGGHKALDDFSMVGHTHNRLEQNLILACSLYATDSYNAYKIITKWNKSWNHMPTINIRGYAYGSSKTIDCDIVIYHYSDTPCNYSCTNKGSYPIEVYQQLENDVQVFYIRPGEYYGMFNVFVYGGMGVTSDYYTGWTMTSVDAIQGTRITQYAIATDITGSASYATNAGNADTVDGYHFSDLEDRYVNVSGDWMDEDAQISFKGPSGSTSIYARLGYMATSLSGFTMHGGSQNKAFYIHSNGYAANSDTGGLAIDNDGVTVFGAGDDGKVFRVINEDNFDDGPQFIVTKGSGATTKYSHTAQRFISTVAIGTQPYACSSTTLNNNLNADLLDDKHATQFLEWEAMKSGWDSAPFQEAVDYFKNLSNLNNGAKILYSYYGGEYTMLFTRRSDATAHGTILKWGYPDTYIRIIRLTSGNPASSNWEKISAGYADSAGTANYATNAGNADTLDGYHLSNLYWANINVQTSLSTDTTPQFGRVGIGTAYKTDGDGLLNFPRDNVAINFRQDSGCYSKIEYMSLGNEALVFANQYPYSSFIFKNNLNLTNTNDWQESNLGTPAVQIKYSSLYINKAIGNGVTPDYNFYVNGNSYLNGRTIINYAASNGTGALEINAGGASYAYALDIQSSIATGDTLVAFVMGVAHGTNNQLSGLFKYVGSGSTSNLFGFGFYGNDFLLNIRADGNVGIGTSSPSQKLHVAGNEYITGYINLNDHGYLQSGRSTSFNYGYSLSLGDSGNSMGMFSGPGGGEEGAIIVSPDTCIVYNSSDTGHNFSVYDKDLGGDLTTNTSLTFDIIGNGDYRAWSRGGFYKNGSSDSYVLLGAGGHKALDDFSMVGHTHNRLEQNLILACSLYATGSYNAYKIITKWNKSWNHMPTINIRGYAYGSAKTIDCDIVMYHYSDTPCSYSCTNKGSYAIEVYQQLENDVQVFYIRPGEYYGMFNVFVYGGMGVTSDYYTGWTMTSVDAIQGTRITQYAIATDITGSASYATNAGNADTVDGYHFSDLEDRYVNVSGDWMDWAAPIYFKGPNTSVYGRIQYSSTSISGLTMHGGGQSYALYIDSNGYSGAGDTGGIAIDNDGVTAFGAGDTGYVFRVLNEDNVGDGAQFWVTKAGGTYSKRGFIKEGYNDNYVLLAGGGTVAISSLTGGSSTDTNTWRGIYVNDSSWKGNGIDTGYMNIKAGSNVSLSTSGNTLTISSSYSDSNTWRPVQCDGTSIGSSTLNIKAGTNVTLSRSGGDITISASGGSSTSGAYLPLAGGTMTGETIFSSSSDASAFRPDKNNYHYIGTESYRWWKAFINNVYGTFHHKDMNSDDYALCAGGGYKRIGGNDWPMIPIVPSDGVMEIGRYIDFHKVDAESNDYSVRIDCNHQTGNTIYLPTGTGKYIALTDNSDGSVSSSGGGTTVTHYTSTSAKQYVLGSGNGSQPGNNTTLSSVYSYSNFYFTSSGAYHGSDMRLKTDIHDILNEDVQKLFNTNNAFVRHFKWRENNVDSYGFIAQELQEYCPEAVDFNEDTGYYSVNYDVALSKIVGVMFKKIKEQDRIIKDLQSKLQ